MLTARWLGGLLALLLTLAVAACGEGSGGAGSSGSEAARFLPGSVPFFATLATDFESDQWQAAQDLIERFPSGRQALEELPEGALGPEVAFAVLDLDSSQEEPPIVLVANPDDPAAFERELGASDDVPVWRQEEGGWYVVADTQATLDRVAEGATAGSLADDEGFETSLAELPDDALARFYVDGAALTKAVAAAAPESGSVDPAAQGGPQLETVAVAIQAEEAGIRVDGVARIAGELEAQAFSLTLDSLVPEDALVYVAFADVRSSLQSFLDQAAAAGGEDAAEALPLAGALLGVDLQEDLLPLFAGEHALFIRAGAPVPEVTLILSPDDPEAGLATIDKLIAGLPALAESAGDESPFTTTDTTIAGVQVKTVDFVDEDVSLSYALVNDRIVLSTQPKGIADVASGSGSLSDDPLYSEALSAAGPAAETTGLLFVNLEEASSLLESLGSVAGADAEALPLEALEGLDALRYLLVSGSAEQSEVRFAGFLAIE